MPIAGVFVKVDGGYAVASTQQNFVKTGGVYFHITGAQLAIKADGVWNFGIGEVPVNLTLPVIAGTPDVGATLTCTPGTWSGDPVPVITHQWFSDGIPVTGETGLTYVVRLADAGKPIICGERGSNVVGSIAVPSNSILIPAAAFSSAFSDAFDNG
jgi:hypothetical protein